MDERRRAWLAERRAAVTAQYDDEAPTYDAEADYPVPLQPLFVRRLVDSVRQAASSSTHPAAPAAILPS